MATSPQTLSSTSPAVLAGLVERVTFHNEENGFSVLRVKARGQRELITVVGHAATISAGEFIQASGSWANDRAHGPQFKAAFLKVAAPTTSKREAGYKQLANKVAQVDHRATQIMLKHDQEKERRRAEQKQAEPPAAPAQYHVVIPPHNGRKPLDPEYEAACKADCTKVALAFAAQGRPTVLYQNPANENRETVVA